MYLYLSMSREAYSQQEISSLLVRWQLPTPLLPIQSYQRSASSEAPTSSAMPVWKGMPTATMSVPAPQRTTGGPQAPAPKLAAAATAKPFSGTFQSTKNLSSFSLSCSVTQSLAIFSNPRGLEKRPLGGLH